MASLFYIAAAVTVIGTVLAVTRANAVHALLYLVVALLALALVFYVLGAPFIAALQVIVYGGAIMVLFLYVVMLLGLGESATARESRWIRPKVWIGPALLALVLGVELLFVVGVADLAPAGRTVASPRTVGLVLFGPYLLGVEIASMLLLAGLVAAYHLGRRPEAERPAVELPATGARSRRHGGVTAE